MTSLANRILEYLNESDYEVRSSVQVAIVREMCMDEIYGPIDLVFQPTKISCYCISSFDGEGDGMCQVHDGSNP